MQIVPSVSKIYLRLSRPGSSESQYLINSFIKLVNGFFVSLPLVIADFYRTVFSLHSRSCKNIILDLRLNPKELPELLETFKQLEVNYIAGVTTTTACKLNGIDIYVISDDLQNNIDDKDFYRIIPFDGSLDKHRGNNNIIFLLSNISQLDKAFEYRWNVIIPDILISDPENLLKKLSSDS